MGAMNIGQIEKKVLKNSLLKTVWHKLRESWKCRPNKDGKNITSQMWRCQPDSPVERSRIKREHLRDAD